MIKRWKIFIGGVCGLALMMGGVVLFYNENVKPLGVEAGVADNVSGYAWSENIGWISFNCANTNLPLPQCSVFDYGVNLDTITGNFSGRAWAENIGFITFNIGEMGACPAGACQPKLDLVSGVVSGWARAMTPLVGGQLGGWDGWISFNCANTGTCGASNYNVYLDSSGPTPKLTGWAWGGGGSTASNAVVGWIAFDASNNVPTTPPAPTTNCTVAICQTAWPSTIAASCQSSPYDCGVDRRVAGVYTATTCGANVCVCCEDDWHVIPPPITPPNTPPEKPDSLDVTLDKCAFGTFNPPALGLSIQLSWHYEDDESNPQVGFEIEIDNNPSMASPEFHYTEESAPACSSGSTCGYTLYLGDDDEGDAPAKLDWAETYTWQVKVKDSNGDWSVWSNKDNDNFDMPIHASPFIDFTYIPSRPSTDEIIQLADQSECYDAFDNVVACPVGGFTWTANTPLPAANFTDGTTRFDQNPRITYATNNVYQVNLEVIDVDTLRCNETKNVNVALPLPGWREISP